MYMMTSAHPLFGASFAVLLVSSIFFQYATFACIEQNGALTTQILSNVRAAFQVNCFLFLYFTSPIINYRSSSPISCPCTSSTMFHRVSSTTSVSSALEVLPTISTINGTPIQCNRRVNGPAKLDYGA